MQSEQEKLIGRHPLSPNIFGNWLVSEDITIDTSKPNKKHRKLSEISGQRSSAVKEIADWIIEHHVSAKKIKRFQNRKAAILSKYGISIDQYLDDQKLFPIVENTKMGNATEIILIRYLKETSGLAMLAYKLHYNPNVDQSMKGDDCLLFQTSQLNNKIIVGEAKYRKTPSKQTVTEIVENLESSKRLPISLPFISAHLSASGNDDLAAEIEDLIFEVSRGLVPIVNVGLLLSSKGINRTSDTSMCVQYNLDSTNDRLLLLSLGVDNPKDLINSAFELAKTTLLSQI